MKLRAKLLAIIFIIILISGSATFFLIKNTMSDTIMNEFQTRGTSIARHIAVQSDDLILTEDIVKLQRLIRNTKDNEPEVVYIFITLPDNKLLVHTFKDRFPIDLLNVNNLGENFSEQVVSLKSENETIRDFAYPIMNGEIGTVRVGMSENNIRQRIDDTILQTIEIILVMMVLGMIMTYIIAEYFVQSVTKLRNAAREIGNGNLVTQIAVNSYDEIGELAQAFNKMARELKKSNDKIVSAKEYTDNIVRSMTNTLLVLSSDGTIQTVNPAACKLLGFHESELIGKNASMVFPDEKNLLMNGNEHDQLFNKGSIGNIEKTYISKDGKHIPVIFSASIMHDNAGKILGIVCIAHDITERKRAQEIQIENERLAYASKTKSDFLANMSHELRTPLNSIIGFSELLMQKTSGELNQKQERYVENVIQSGTHLLGLISDILDLSKVEAGKLELTVEKMPVHETLNETLDLIREKSSKLGISLEREYDPELEFIEADEQRFKQVLLNLLSNAVKFSKKNGGKIIVSTKKEGNLARISVSDTGIGIMQKDMDKLFKKFEQLDSGISKNYGGTGLGLAISKKLVEMHGGKIWAESIFGEGTKFTFSLPIQKQK